MIKQIIIVGLGGGLGSILRFLSSVYTARYYVGVFPLATFFINMIGCFLIGLFAAFILNHYPLSYNLKLLLLTGFCGGYTTFSAFAFENWELLQNNHPLIMLSYIAASVLLGILFVYLGLTLGSSL